MNDDQKSKEESNQNDKGPGAIVISKTIAQFLEYIRIEDQRVLGTLETYRHLLERWVRHMGDGPVTGIAAERVWLFKRKLTDAGLGPATIGMTLSVLRVYLRYLRDVQGVNVFDGDKIRRPKIPRRQVEYLTKEELQRFMEAIPTKRVTGLRDRALVEVLCSTGMRISEALSLDRDRLDMERREAVIIGKGNRQRKVYFSGTTLDWIGRYLAHRHDDDPALFISDGGRPRRLDHYAVWKTFQRYGKRSGLAKHVHPHMLRHTMATTLLANGCPIGHIRELLGHANLTTTCRYYLGRMSEQEVKAAHDKYLSYDVSNVLKADDKASEG